MNSPEVLVPYRKTDANGVTYVAVLGGLKIIHPNKDVEYLYLNPSSDDSDGLSNVFVYLDKGNYESPHCYIAIGERHDAMQHDDCAECGTSWS